MRKIILASSSPQRRELLQKLGIDFEVRPSDFDEASLASADPHHLTRSLALAKATSVARMIPDGGALVIGADTVVNFNGEIFGKPKDARHAREMLKKLNGNTHSVVTGFAIYDTSTHKFVTDSVETRLQFKSLSNDEIDAYVGSGEPFGQAGGYAIQGLASFFVEKVNGDYNNVLGLPTEALTNKLCEFGVLVGE
ncbi:MAG: Maf family protein [bacterium]|nr:Maf family protein [bacterium]